jgi:hypothetical protein
MNYIGDFAEDSTVRIVLTTNNGDGAAVAPSSAFEAADFVIYKNGSTTQKATTNGITISSPFDSVVGLHVLEIDTSNDTGDSGFWTTGADYWVIAVPDETIDSQTVVGVIATFSLQNRYSSARLAAIEADTLDIQSRLPATLDGGLMRSSVESMNSNTITASVIATGAITASAIQTNAITDEKLASSAITEIQSGLATSAGVTAAFTEIKGAGWSSATDTLEKIADSSGGGGTVTVAPLSSLAPERVNGTTISVAVGDVSPVSIDVYDANGVAIDLTAQGNLEVCIESRDNIDLQVVAHASITISGTGNRKATWTPNAAAVGTVDKQRWSLRTASGKRVLAYGPWVVERVALNDA